MAEFSSDIIKFVGQGVQLKVFLKNGNEHVGGHGTPDLRLECALACDQKLLDAQVLFYPIEKQLDLPTVEWRQESGRPWTVQSTSSDQRNQAPRVPRASRIHELPALRDLGPMFNVDADQSNLRLSWFEPRASGRTFEVNFVGSKPE